MSRKFKFLGLALAAVFAMSAVGATAASATTLDLEGSPITLTGANHNGANAFDVQYGEVKCTTAKYNGTLTGSSVTTATITPTYEGCTFAGIAATVDMNGCDYLLHLSAGGPPFEGTVDVVCPVGQEITVTGGNKCTVHVPPQLNLGPATVTNTGAGSTRELTLHLEGIQNVTYTQTKGAGVAPCTNLTTNAGKLTGTVTVTGETDVASGATHTGIWVT